MRTPSPMPTDPAGEVTPPVLRDPVEEKLRQAMADGSWDDLPGMGKPLPDLDREYEPGWWAKRWVAQQKQAMVVDELRRAIRDELPRLRTMRDREAARERADTLNRLVAEVNERLPVGERIPAVEL